MSRDVFLVLLGAGIALASSVVAAWVQHKLSLKADEVKRRRDLIDRELERRRANREREGEKQRRRKEKTAEALREDLLTGVRETTLSASAEWNDPSAEWDGPTTYTLHWGDGSTAEENSSEQEHGSKEDTTDTEENQNDV